MTQIIITIPDQAELRVFEGIATALNYTDNQLRDETKEAFAKRMVIKQIIEWVTGAEMNVVILASTAAKQQDIASNVRIT